MNETITRRDTGKRHICLQCGTAFSRPYRLKQHEKMHLKIKEFVCGEPNCDKSYFNKSHLDRHIQSVHIDKQFNVIYSCPECRKVYANRQNLKRHIKVAHSRKGWFNCDVCSSSFKKKHQLSAHMFQHTFVKSFSCELCSCEFITIMQKRKHMRQHKTYSCEFCDMAFVRWSLYWKHKKMMHSEFICDDCGRKFYKRVHMVRHTKIHNKRHTPTFYPCSYENCERVYSRNNNLKEHIKIKHLNILHDCKVCGARLTTKAKLAVHLSTHSKPKKCNQPTQKDFFLSRQARFDKGITKLSTALRIAGLTFDPEDENIRGTLKATIGHNEPIIEDENKNGITVHIEPKIEDENMHGITVHIEPITEDENINGTTDHIEPKIKDKNINGITVHIEPKIEDKNKNGITVHVEPKIEGENMNGITVHIEPITEDENINGTTINIEPKIEDEKDMMKLSDIVNSSENISCGPTSEDAVDTYILGQ